MTNNESLYAILDEAWLMRGWNNAEFVLVNWHTNEMIYLADERERFVALSCDAAHNFASALYFPLHRTILQRFIENGFARVCDEGSAALHPAQQYRKAACPIVRSVLWSVTNHCNFRCRHCYMEAPKHAYRETTRDEMFAILDTLDAANVPDISFTGGEPFMRPDIWEVMRRMYEKRINLSELFTNASLINNRLLDRIEQIGYKPCFKVSFDCVGAHNYMRGVPTAEEDTLRGIRTLTERGYQVVIISSVDSVVLSHIPETLDVLIDLGIDSWWISPPVEAGVWKGSSSKSTVSETVNALKNLVRLWADRDRPIDLLLWYFGVFKRKGSNHLHQGNGRLFTADGYECLASKYYPYIAPDGKLLPCGSYIGTEIARDMPNILDSSFAKAWSDPVLRHCCDLKKNEVLLHNAQCAGCEHFPDCGSGCRIAAFLESGEYLAREKAKCAVFRGGYYKDFIRYTEELTR